MTSIAIITAMAVLGIEVGWQPLPEGGHEYTIQIEPQLLELIAQGQEIESEVPPEIQVRRYRVKVGTKRLAKIAGQTRSAPAAAPQFPEPPQDEPSQPAEPPTRAVTQPRSTRGAAPQFPEPPDDEPAPPARTVAQPSYQEPEPPLEPVNDHAPQHGSNPFNTAADDAPPAQEPPPADRRPAHPGEAPTFSNLDEPAGPVDERAAAKRTNQPGMLGKISSGSKSIEPATHSENVRTEKPRLPPASDVETEPARPWFPLMVAMFLLCCSLGANAYLGWIAVEARRGHREALARIRTA